MKIRDILMVFTILMFIVACGNTGGEIKLSKNSNAILKDESLMASEVKPDFSSPLVIDEDLVVDNMPESLIWYTSRPGVFGSTRAKSGGKVTLPLSEFPQTFRTVGPNSNGGFRSILSPSAALIGLNSETNEWIPQLATHWAFSNDNRTVYFKLNEKVLWNDGNKVTSKDYLFMLEMMRSKDIQAPWYNDFYTNSIVDIKAYGDYVISVTGNVDRAADDLLYNINISPRPSHHYNGEIPEDFVDKYQWVYEPTVGPYYMDSFTKGETVTFKKVENWWGYCYDYNLYRYNIEEIHLKVISGGTDIIREYFYNGEIDQFGLIIPKEWADSENHDYIKKGYIDRVYSFYVPLTGVQGIVLNTQAGIFRDNLVRTGLYYAINMDKMIATVLRGEYNRYHNIGLAHVFAGVNFDDETIRVPDFDPAIAADYFDRAGYTVIGSDGIREKENGERLSFEMIYTAPVHTERLSILKEEAKKCGLEIKLNNMTEGAFSLLLEKKHEAFFIGMSTGPMPSPWQYFHSDNAKEQTNNFFMVEDELLDRLTTDFKEESDLKTKAEINIAIQQRVHELALVIPSYTVPYTRSAMWKWLRVPAWLNQKYSDSFTGTIGSIMGGYDGYIWLDEDIKKEVIQAKMKGEAFEPRTYIDETHR